MIDAAQFFADHTIESIVGIGGGGLGTGALLMMVVHGIQKKKNGVGGLTEAQATNLIEINMKAGDTNSKLDRIISLLETQNRGNK